MLALLSPAKTLDYDSSYQVPFTGQPLFKEEVQYLVKKIRGHSPKRLTKLMNVSEEIAQLNADRFQNFSESYVEGENARPAAMAFKGDVYLGLDAYTLNNQELEVLNTTVGILSGLYGILKPLDLVQPYRMEMGLPFKVTPAKSNLYKYWGDSIKTTIENWVERQDDNKEKIVVNLASNEYAKAAQLNKMSVPVIEVDFKERRPNGEYKTISFTAKKARGLMARFMVKENLSKAEDLKAFNYEEYQYNPSMSEDAKWTFTR